MPRPLPVVPDSGLPPAEPLFAKIGVVGLGLIGGSVALACRRLWPKGLVIGVDRNDVIEEAVARHAIDVAADDAGVLAEAELIVLAAPVRDNVARLSELDQHVRGRVIVTDVGSTKRAIVAAARGLPSRFAFVGGHPLAGAARAGIGYAAPDLFSQRPWLLTPVGEGGGEALERVTAFVRALGAIPHVMDPASHDRLVAFLSHLPQLTASALMSVIGQGAGPEGLPLAGQGLVDTTRLASSPASVWSDICGTNADEIGRAIDELIVVLQRLRAGLSDPGEIQEVFEAANSWRVRLTATRHPEPL